MEHRGHALVTGLVRAAAQDRDRGATAALAEDDPGCRGDEVGEGLLLPFAAVLRHPEGRHACRVDGDDGGAAAVSAAAGVGDDRGDSGAGVMFRASRRERAAASGFAGSSQPRSR